jgi:hypothetical protein
MDKLTPTLCGKHRHFMWQPRQNKYSRQYLIYKRTDDSIHRFFFYLLQL